VERGSASLRGEVTSLVKSAGEVTPLMKSVDEGPLTKSPGVGPASLSPGTADAVAPVGVAVALYGGVCRTRRTALTSWRSAVRRVLDGAFQAGWHWLQTEHGKNKNHWSQWSPCLSYRMAMCEQGAALSIFLIPS